MGTITITSSERGRDFDVSHLETCCGVKPYAYRWPKKKLVAVMCSNEQCDLHTDGVLCGDSEVEYRWNKFRKKDEEVTA